MGISRVLDPSKGRLCPDCFERELEISAAHAEFDFAEQTLRVAYVASCRSCGFEAGRGYGDVIPLDRVTAQVVDVDIMRQAEHRTMFRREL